MPDKEQEHECPYGGAHVVQGVWGEHDCGHRGFLCHRCREDRADARVKLMVREMFAVLAAEWDRLEAEEAKDA